MTLALKLVLVGFLLSVPEMSRSAPSQGAMEKPDLPDVELIDQDGQTVKLYSGLVKGRTVAINFIFTSCTMICSPLGATFGRLQKELREKKDLHFITISLDPDQDTPQKLKSFASQFQRQPGWTLLTGHKPSIEKVLRALGGDVIEKELHTPIIILGNDRTGQWVRYRSLVPVAELKTRLDKLH
jgi:protein SCO1/2